MALSEVKSLVFRENAKVFSFYFCFCLDLYSFGILQNISLSSTAPGQMQFIC